MLPPSHGGLAPPPRGNPGPAPGIDFKPQVYWAAIFCIHASEVPVIIMNQLKSVYNSPFKDSYSHPIHLYFPVIANNVISHNYNKPTASSW